MEEIWSTEIDTILGVGHSLVGLGVRNWALEREPALTALGRLRPLGVAVLGGDVYDVAGSSIQPNYDSWYCNRHGREGDDEFVERSIAEAKNYITTYKAKSGSVLFAIVPSVNLSSGRGV